MATMEPTTPVEPTGIVPTIKSWFTKTDETTGETTYNTWIIVVIILAVIAVVGLIIYFVMRSNKDKSYDL
jgi:flagellar basal body-associated protein FliL